MDIQELWHVLNWLEKQVHGPGVQKKYTKLAAILQHNVNNQPHQSLQPILDELLNALRAMPMVELTGAQIDFLRRLSIAAQLGDEGANYLQDILQRNALDLPTAAARVSDASTRLQKGLESARQVLSGLKGAIDVPEESNDEATLRVTFTGMAAINNVVELEKWAIDWNAIARGVAMSHDKAPEDFRIVSASRGSITLVLVVTRAIAWTLGSMANGGLALVERYLNIKKQLQEIRKLEIENDHLETILNSAADKARQTDTEDLIAKVQQDTLPPGVDGDKSVALAHSTKLLIGFLEKGGRIDVYLPASPNEKENAKIEELRETYRTIRHREEAVRQLIYMPEDTSDEDK